MRTIVVFAFGLVLAGSPLLAAPALVTNGSFEEMSIVEGSPTRDRGAGKWTLDHSRMPTHWRLNEVYPGRLSVLEYGGHHGRRNVLIAAAKGRDAQMYQPIPGFVTGRWYRFSARLRDGTASLLVYEYRKGSPAPVAKTLASGTAGKQEWRRIAGYYCPEGEDFESASIVLLVPKGRKATFDYVTLAETGVAPPSPKASAVTFENAATKLVLGPRGRLRSLFDRKNKRELADAASTTTFLTAVRNGLRIPVNSVRKSGGGLTVTFVEPEIAVRLVVTKRKEHFAFHVKRVEPDDLDSLELAFPVTPLKTRGVATNGTWDDRTGLCHRSVTPNGECRLVARRRAICPTVTWYRRHLITGGRSALVATAFPRFFAAVEAMEEATGLPSPKLPDRWGGDGKGKRRWARTAGTVGRSYLFVTGYAPGELDFLIDAAKTGGFDLILFLDAIWKKSAGHYQVREDNFPGGLEGLRAAGERIHAAGLGFGLHFIGATVSENDAYVTPRPDPRLLGLPCETLSDAVSKEATTLTLSRPPAQARLLRRVASGFPGHWLQIGNEIVRFEHYVAGPPAKLTGVIRGALGTAAAAHRKGAPVRTLVNAYRCFLVDPDSDIVPELARSLADLVNGVGADMVYFDAIGTIDPASGIDTWYYLNRLVPPLCAGFKRDVLVQTGMGLGRQMLWHLVPRSASADGHGDLKGYLDRRLPQIRTIRREFSAADVGWYALDLATERDQLEYIAARCMALGASISVQANRFVLTRHPRAREILEMLERYERCRLAGGLAEKDRAALLAPGQDFRLLEAEAGKWRLFNAEYGPAHVIRAIDGTENVVTVENPSSGAVRLEVELTRERQAVSPADRNGPDARVVLESGDLSAWQADGSSHGLKADFQRGPTPGSMVLSAPSSRSGGGWFARSRRFDPPLDLSRTAAFAADVLGDGNGQVLTVRFVDRAGSRRNWNIPVGFKGYRFRSFARPAAKGFDWKAVERVILRVSGIPRETATKVLLGPVKALPAVRAPVALENLVLRLGGRTLVVPGKLSPGQTITIDALGRATLWPGGMAPGRPLAIEGLPITIPPGRHVLRLESAESETYPGDLLLRVSRQWE